MSSSKRERREQRQAERQAHNEAQRDAAERRRRSKRIINYAIALVFVGAAAYFLFQAFKPDNSPGQYDELAQCLTAKGVVMYGTEWCPHCQAQKELFGNSFRYVTYVDCDRAPEACSAAGVEGYPTWTFPDGSSSSGVQQLDVLAQKAECSLNATNTSAP